MGVRYKKKTKLVVFLAIISFFGTLFYLPSNDGGGGLIRTGQLVRDRMNRNIGRISDQQKLLYKVRLANISHEGVLAKPNINKWDEELIFRRNYIVNMTKFGWDKYKQYAWGDNELRPVSKTGHSASIFGRGKLGATIIDSLDTLYIMGLDQEFADAKRFVEEEFDLKKMEGEISVFEINIRFVGGLLAAYALTKEKIFLQKANETATLLLPAFNTPTGIPYAVVNLQTGSAHNWGWANGGCSILSEFGTLQLEFDYLSSLTNLSIYSDKITRLRNHLLSVKRKDGLYPNYLNPVSGKWGTKHVSVGALGDSFYEYLLKTWLRSNRTDVIAKDMYDNAVSAIKKNLLRYSEQSHLAYFAELKGSRLEQKMDHLACFTAGMFALQALNEENVEASDNALKLAEEIGNTCHESYIRTATKIGPESFRFTNEVEAESINDREKYYILRPEVIEGWYYLWKATRNKKYRDWCWDAALAIDKYCRTQNGFSGIRNVYQSEVAYDDVQQSFLFSETFKYLYLVFSDDSVMSLDKWVFNTEAHAFPIQTL